MECPACRKPMVILEYKGVELDFCTACKGCWLDWGELGIFLRGELDMAEDWTLVGERTGRRRCPRCRTRMKVGKLPDMDIEVDVCPERHGVWCDGGELVRVVASRASGEAGTRAQQWLREVFEAETKSPTKEGGTS